LALEPRGKVGEIVHKLVLSNCQLPNGAKVTDILSEGEQRIVSIASFLGELEACGHSNPVVFDDPVSSLDHIWREKVAHRLVIEASNRQVIVFTHDIVFTTVVMDSAEATSAPLAVRCILRRGDTLGIPAEDIPWKAANVKQSIDTLEKEVAQLRKTQKSLTTEQYAQAACPIYSKMRATWENAIEQVVFQSTVRRFNAHVRISPDIKKVTVFEIADCKTLLTAYKKCCDITEAHSNIAATNAPIPEPAEITEDLDTLKNWVNNIKGKQSKVS
jgi:ABC-type proline/glycine betaine transport system ATPase subunit